MKQILVSMLAAIASLGALGCGSDNAATPLQPGAGSRPFACDVSQQRCDSALSTYARGCYQLNDIGLRFDSRCGMQVRNHVTGMDLAVGRFSTSTPQSAMSGEFCSHLEGVASEDTPPMGDHPCTFVFDVSGDNANRAVILTCEGSQPQRFMWGNCNVLFPSS
jgi:hypothetical protein